MSLDNALYGNGAGINNNYLGWWAFRSPPAGAVYSLTDYQSVANRF
jgi:hypothetical protein